MISPKEDVNAQVKAVAAVSQETAAGVMIALVAGATEDGVKVVGQSIDRSAYENPQSVCLAVAAGANLGASETFSVAIEYQTSADGSSWDTAVALLASTAIITDSGSGGDGQYGATQVALNLRQSTLKRYIRFNVTPALSAASLDDAIWAATAVLGGLDTLPPA